MIKWMTVIILLLLPFTSIGVEAKGAEVYIAIGDSLAAGQTPNRAIDAGYTDLIAQELTHSHQLAFYSKALAFPGYTTADVLKTVQRKEAKELLKDATVITISAGANDMLSLVQVNPSKGSIAYQQIAVNYALNNVRQNVGKIIQEIKKVAPKAKIYVMGYYFAYPHVHDLQKQGMKKELNTLHTILKTEAEISGATYVAVEQEFNNNEKELLPNPTDVHPSMEGYRLMANAFFKQYNTRLQVDQNELPIPNPLTFEQILHSQKEKGEASVSKFEGLEGFISLTQLKLYI